jgi:hypothetical protein
VRLLEEAKANLQEVVAILGSPADPPCKIGLILNPPCSRCATVLDTTPISPEGVLMRVLVGVERFRAGEYICKVTHRTFKLLVRSPSAARIDPLCYRGDGVSL